MSAFEPSDIRRVAEHVRDRTRAICDASGEAPWRCGDPLCEGRWAHGQRPIPHSPHCRVGAAERLLEGLARPAASLYHYTADRGYPDTTRTVLVSIHLDDIGWTVPMYLVGEGADRLWKDEEGRTFPLNIAYAWQELPPKAPKRVAP